jgi:ADP-ribose pyrophosphatase YjhB (NUDIX family)
MPGIAVNVAIVDKGKILLTKREDFEVWCLPSGGVENGESLIEAATRETKEETGIAIHVTSLVGIYSRLGETNDIHAILYAARPIGGELKIQNGETLEVKYFSLDELPEELLFGHKRRIMDAFHGAIGICTKQELINPEKAALTRNELYRLRDQSSIPRQEFYLNRMKSYKTRETVQLESQSST